MELALEPNGFAKGNRLCTLRNRLLGTPPEITELGDNIAVLSGCHIPIVLRLRGDSYEVIGPSFSRA